MLGAFQGIVVATAASLNASLAQQVPKFGFALTLDTNEIYVTKDNSTWTSFGGGGATTTLQAAYTNGGAGGGAIVLTASGGAIKLKDNATPIGTDLFDVTSNDGTSIYFGVSAAGAAGAVLTLHDGASAAVSPSGSASIVYNNSTQQLQVSINGGAYTPIGAGGALGNWTFSGNSATLNVAAVATICTANATGVTIGNSSGTQDAVLQTGTGNNAKLASGVAVVRVIQSLGCRMEYNSSLISLDGASCVIQGAGANGTYGPNTITDGNLTTTGATLAVTASAGKIYMGTLSGVAGVLGYGEDLVADAGGTTANKVVVWSGANKVQIPAATANLHTIAGVALTTTAAAGTAQVARHGRHLVSADAGIAAGDLVVTSGAVAGNVAANNAAAAGTIVGRACEATGGTVAGQVTVDVLLA